MPFTFAVNPFGKKVDVSILLQDWSVVFWLPTFAEIVNGVAVLIMVSVTFISYHQPAAKVALKYELVCVLVEIIGSSIAEHPCHVYVSLKKNCPRGYTWINADPLFRKANQAQKTKL